MTQPGSIQRHLEELRTRLAELPGRERILAEAEDHLVEAAAELQQAGMSAIEAEQRATLCFGEPKDVAERFERQLKQEEMMQSHKNLRGVRILAAVLSFTAVTQSAGLTLAALGGNSLAWFGLLQPLVQVVLAFGLWHHRGWSRKGLMICSAVLALWGAVLMAQWLLVGEMLVAVIRIPPVLLLPSGILTICIAVALFRYMLRPEVRLQLAE